MLRQGGNQVGFNVFYGATKTIINAGSNQIGFNWTFQTTLIPTLNVASSQSAALVAGSTNTSMRITGLQPERAPSSSPSGSKLRTPSGYARFRTMLLQPTLSPTAEPHRRQQLHCRELAPVATTSACYAGLTRSL